MIVMVDSFDDDANLFGISVQVKETNILKLTCSNWRQAFSILDQKEFNGAL